MSLELVRESTKVNYVVGEELAQTIVEHDIIVPDVNPDVARILLIDGEIREGILRLHRIEYMWTVLFITKFSMFPTIRNSR